MTGFDAAPMELQASAALLEQVGEQLRSGLTRLVAEMDDLLCGGWRGESASAFGRGWTPWRNGAEEVLLALDSMAHALATAGRAYDETDASAAGGFGRVG